MTSSNIAFIDGQNLHLGVDWKIDFKRLRRYLKDKYKIEYAYYFMGYLVEREQDLYTNLQRSGFIVQFKKHNELMASKKKGNVDSDMVFEIMKSLIEEDFNKILIVSGDGDYKKMIDYLIKKGKFLKILFPNQKKASSLYKPLTSHFYSSMDGLKSKLMYKKERAT